MARHSTRHRVNGELDRDMPPRQLVIQLADPVLGLRNGHPVTRNNHDQRRLLEKLGGPFDRFRLVLPLLSAALRCRHLSETAEQDVQERPVHRATHNDRKNKAARSRRAPRP